MQPQVVASREPGADGRACRSGGGARRRRRRRCHRRAGPRRTPSVETYSRSSAGPPTKLSRPTGLICVEEELLEARPPPGGRAVVASPLPCGCRRPTGRRSVTLTWRLSRPAPPEISEVTATLPLDSEPVAACPGVDAVVVDARAAAGADEVVAATGVDGVVSLVAASTESSDGPPSKMSSPSPRRRAGDPRSRRSAGRVDDVVARRRRPPRRPRPADAGRGAGRAHQVVAGTGVDREGAVGHHDVRAGCAGQRRARGCRRWWRPGPGTSRRPPSAERQGGDGRRHAEHGREGDARGAEA